MFLTPFVLLLILVVWGLKDEEIYGKEAVGYVLVGFACLAAVLTNVSGIGLYLLIPVCLMDIFLVFKLIGNPQAF